MSRKKEAEEMEETEGLHPETLEQEEEQDRVLSMMTAISGRTEAISLYLHRADENNARISGPFLKIYPSDTPIETIYRESQTEYKGGNFILVARDDKRIISRAPFSVESLETETVETGGGSKSVDKIMEELADTLRRTMLIDKMKDLKNPQSGGDINSGMYGVLSAMVQSNTQLLTTLLPLMLKQNNNAPAIGPKEIMEIIKTGIEIGSGREPGGNADSDSIIGLAGKALPILGQIFANPNPGSRRMPNPPRPVALPRPAGSEPPPPPPPPPQPVTDESTLRINKVMETINYVLTLPNKEDVSVFEYLAATLDFHFPGWEEELVNATDEQFIALLAQINPDILQHKEYLLKFKEWALNEAAGDEMPEGVIKDYETTVVNPRKSNPENPDNPNKEG